MANTVTLTVDETLTCFEILSAMWADTGSVQDGYGIQVSLSQLNLLKTEIANRLGPLIPDPNNPGYYLGLDDGSATRVKVLAANWNALGTSPVSIKDGNAGAISGMSYNIEDERDKIRQLLNTYVPVLHIADSIKRKQEPNTRPGPSIRMSSMNRC